MRYLVTTNDSNPPFLTNIFDYENNYNADVGMIVYDLINSKFTKDGKNWKNIDIDKL